MSDEHAVHVNFGRPIALFPLDGVSLFPHQVVPLHIFEPRYRRMVQDALDASGLIAMAVHDARATREAGEQPPIRRAVCIGHIVRHERLPDGRHNILLQGVCRARIRTELPLAPDRPYRVALLEHVGNDPDALGSDDERAQRDARAAIARLLTDGDLRRLVAAEPLMEYVRNDDISTPAVLELVASVLAHREDVRYELLAQASAAARADLLLRELGELDVLVRRAVAQHPERWPKGMSWN